MCSIPPWRWPRRRAPFRWDACIVGEKFKENFPDTNVKLVTISDPSVEWAHNQRTMAFVRGLPEVFPDLEHVFNGGKSDREIAYSTVEDVLQRDPEVNVIFGYDAENGLGAIAALEASGRGQAEDYVCKTEMVVSVDGSTDEILKVIDPKYRLCGYAGPAAERERPRLRGHDAQGHQRRN